jgi:hypothetical protein
VSGFISSRFQKVVRLGLVNILVIPEEMIFLLSDLDGAATILYHTMSLILRVSSSPSKTYLRNQHLITSLDAHSYPLSIFIESAGSDSKDVGLVQFLDAALGQEDAAGGAGFCFDSLHEYAVQQWDERFDGFQGGGLLGLWLVSWVPCWMVQTGRRECACELADRQAACCPEDMVLDGWLECKLTMLTVERGWSDKI